MPWRELMKLMVDMYCLRNEIQKIESELWNLTMKNNDLVSYTQRFQELTMMCTKMVLEEEDRVEKFIEGLPDNITTSSPPDTSLRLGWYSSCGNCIILFVSIRVPNLFICQLYGQQSTELLRVLVFGYQLDGEEHMVIPDIVSVHLVPPRNGRIL
nr:reverse transcriptase domain-containing protein [Tanacetum cinerariifolium]